MDNDNQFGHTLNEMDVEAFLNVRDWLEKALTEAGATITDAEIGVGRAVVGISLEGMPYRISIQPRPIETATEISDEQDG